jgi:RNA polymerase sigma factor (TIGR02999 family)
MSAVSPHSVTNLLLAWNKGDEAALENLIPIIHQELRRIAKHYLNRERSGHTLETSGLVNEAYLRLVGMEKVPWQNRAHFFAVTARLMRRILVDHARSHQYQKRSGAFRKVSLDEALVVSQDRSSELVALDDALNALSKIDPRKAQVVELRFFGGLSVNETAEVLKVSRETVIRDWKLAKVWLLRELNREESHEA